MSRTYSRKDMVRFQKDIINKVDRISRGKDGTSKEAKEAMRDYQEVCQRGGITKSSVFPERRR